MQRLLSLVLTASLATTAVPQGPPPAEAALAEGISLVREGDFERALIRLDEAVRALRSDPYRRVDLARALSYLGTAYLELDQALSARARFTEALEADAQLRLSPREFSAQTIRLFDAVREEMVARGRLPPSVLAPVPDPAASPSPAPSATPGTTVAAAPRTLPASPPPTVPVAGIPAGPGPSPSPSPQRRRGAALWIVAGGVAAAGAAAAALGSSGGGGVTTTVPIGGVTTTVPGSPTTTTPTTTTTPGSTTTTTTPTTTTTTLPPCQGAAISGNVVLPQTGLGSGTCSVTAPGNCSWTRVRSETWFAADPANGTGSAGITVSAGINLGSGRTGTVTMSPGSGQCNVSQSGLLPVQPLADLAWSAELDVPGGRGQIVINTSTVAVQERGQAQGTTARRAGWNRVEAILVGGTGRPGTWRFSVSDPGAQGLRIFSGRVAAMAGDTVTFTLDGRPGERVAFAFRSAE